MAAPEPRLKQELLFITGLRALAALFVMCSHVWYQVWPAVPPPFGYSRHPEGVIASLTGFLYYGHFGVVVFIVLSGFCLMLPVTRERLTLRGGVRGFFKRRVRRILPPYYAALGFALLLIVTLIGEPTGSQWDISLPLTQRGLVAHLLMLQDVIDSTQINYVFWSIALEFHLYLVFPLIVLSFRRFGASRTTLLICGCVYGVIACLEAYAYQEIPPQFIGLVAAFVLGMWCAAELLHAPWAQRVPWHFVALSSSSIVIVCCAAWGPEVAERRLAVLDALCALATLAVLCGAAQGRSAAFRWLERPAWVGVGVFSYSLYLVHAPILHVVWLQLGGAARAPEHQFALLFAFGVPASLIVAYLFFFVFERPFLNAPHLPKTQLTPPTSDLSNA